MATIAQTKRRQLIRSAEGYLDLAVAFEERWSLDHAHRKKLANHAIQCLNEIENPGAHRSYVLFLKGQAHRIARQFWQATNVLEQSAKLEPENLHCWLTLGWCYKRTNRVEAAVDAMEHAIQIDATSAIAHYNLACYWALLENVERAVLHLATAIELDEHYADMSRSERDFDPIRDAGGFRELMDPQAPSPQS